MKCAKVGATADTLTGEYKISGFMLYPKKNTGTEEYASRSTLTLLEYSSTTFHPGNISIYKSPEHSLVNEFLIFSIFGSQAPSKRR